MDVEDAVSAGPEWRGVPSTSVFSTLAVSFSQMQQLEGADAPPCLTGGPRPRNVAHYGAITGHTLSIKGGSSCVGGLLLPPPAGIRRPRRWWCCAQQDSTLAAPTAIRRSTCTSCTHSIVPRGETKGSGFGAF